MSCAYHLAGAAAVIARRQLATYEPTGPLLLRTCGPGGLSHGGFVWPLTPGSVVEAPDWDPTPGRCGGGLHGLLDGGGPGERLDWSIAAVWMVVEALGPTAETDDPGKVRCQRARVIVAGTREEATGYLVARGCVGVHGATSTSGDRGTSTSGDRGTSTSGYGGTSTSGYGGTSTSGYGGTLVLCWHDGTRYRLTVAYVGEDGIEPGVPYRADAQGRPVRADGGGA